MSNNGYLILYDICKQANAHLKKRKAKEVLERKTAYTVAPERNTFERDRLRDILLSKDNKEKSWIMIQIAVNCFKPSTSIRSRKSSPNESYNINRARFLRDSLKTVCPSLKVNTNRSADWPIVKSQNSFFNKICNVVETIQKYGTLIVKYNSPDDPFLLNGVEDDIQTRIYADVFKEGFSESLRKYLDPGTSENKDSPMAWDYAVFLAIEFLRNEKTNRTEFFESKMSRFCQDSCNAKDSISKNSSQAYFNAAVNIMEMIVSNFKLVEREAEPGDCWFQVNNVTTVADDEADPVHPIMFKMKAGIYQRWT
mmetsp:Transcript_737/g.911  ORF Transcript_737/g.911 Transcript_737/m.911 type:complete len:310 (+) Transcript_737:1218-2147(+)